MILIIGAGFVFTGCKKVLDINEDPNNPSVSQATPQLLFPAVQISAASAIGGELAIIGMLWSEYTTEDVSSSQYRNFDSYNVTSSDLSTDYNQLYTGTLNNLEIILQQSKASGDWNYYLMASVMKAYTYQVLVDLYDQVPYTQALQGAVNLQPKFDGGDTIYNTMLNILDTALNQDFGAVTVTNPGGGDYFFWRRYVQMEIICLYAQVENVFENGECKTCGSRGRHQSIV